MDDLISRQAAIVAIAHELDMIDHVPQWVSDRLVKALRGVQSIDAVQVIRCKDCKWQGDDEHCPVCNSCGRGSLPSGDWYCAGGERKES